jgi:hypothetical protein
MTAVEWLIQQICGEHTDAWKEEIKQAKEMEKHQIINAKDCWFEDERDGEQYYNETFKKDKL